MSDADLAVDPGCLMEIPLATCQDLSGDSAAPPAGGTWLQSVQDIQQKASRRVRKRLPASRDFDRDVDIRRRDFEKVKPTA
jgi:hypothetical protein